MHRCPELTGCSLQARCGNVQRVEGLWAAFKASEQSLDPGDSIPAATGRIWALLQLDQPEAALQALRELLAEWRFVPSIYGCRQSCRLHMPMLTAL